MFLCFRCCHICVSYISVSGSDLAWACGQKAQAEAFEWELSDSHIAEGLQRAAWPGRLEWVRLQGET
eukprot:1570690-Rhodomonas_salina.2